MQLLGWRLFNFFPKVFFLQSEQVECRAEECPKLDCHVIKYEPGRCCPECQGNDKNTF